MRRWVLSAGVVMLMALGAVSNALAQAPPATRPDTTAMDWSLMPEYRIVPGDVLKLNFGPRVEEPDEDLVREVHVRPDGRISLYPVGEVVAAGRTPGELHETLFGLFSSYLRDPRFSIEIAEFAGNQVHLLGRVKNPGSYKAEPFITLSQAVARAGGFEDDAATNSVLVLHRDGARTVRVARVALGSALRNGDPAADMMLNRFDIVYIPRSTIGNIDVFVHQFFTLGVQPIVTSSLIGWQLFNLDRVYVPPGRP